MFTALNANIDNMKKELLAELEKQRNTTAKALQDLGEIAKELATQRKEAFETKTKQMRAIHAIDDSSRRTAAIAEKSTQELANLGARLVRLQTELVPPKPKLRCTSSTEEVKGIGSKLAEELKAMGITNVGELLLTDPKSIGARTRATPEMAARLQSRTQLLMIPGVEEFDAEMLMDSGIASKTDLAAKDPVDLGRNLHIIARRYIEEGKIAENERPTVEEIATWIKLAKL